MDGVAVGDVHATREVVNERDENLDLREHRNVAGVWTTAC